MKTGWPRHRENRENREFGSYFFQTGKTQGILFWHREKIANTGKIFGLWLLPAVMKLGQDNIFTGVCLSTGGEGVSASVHAGIYPWEQKPPQSRHPPWGRPPQSRPPLEQTPQEQTPPEQTPPRPDPPPGSSRLQHTVKERPVCIILECILVNIKGMFILLNFKHFLASLCSA